MRHVVRREAEDAERAKSARGARKRKRTDGVEARTVRGELLLALLPPPLPQLTRAPDLTPPSPRASLNAWDCHLAEQNIVLGDNLEDLARNARYHADKLGSALGAHVKRANAASTLHREDQNRIVLWLNQVLNQTIAGLSASYRNARAIADSALVQAEGHLSTRRLLEELLVRQVHKADLNRAHRQWTTNALQSLAANLPLTAHADSVHLDPAPDEAPLHRNEAWDRPLRPPNGLPQHQAALFGLRLGKNLGQRVNNYARNPSTGGTPKVK